MGGEKIESMRYKATLLSLFLIIFCEILFAQGFNFTAVEGGIKIFYLDNEKEVVKKGIKMFSEDYGLVFDRALERGESIDVSNIVVGSLSNIDFKTLIESYHIEIDNIIGEWETFVIKVIEREGRYLLAVIGSDARGATYGVLELSKIIGVSPWVWWADLPPKKREEFSISSSYYDFQKPSVQYRGIFLNDEDWGLMPWSSTNFAPSEVKGAILPRTYEKIFQLLLRLKGNTIWPAMHECTIPFYCVKGNKEMADDYGIVVGTSHCEPLMRNNAGEWDKERYGDYNYITNRERVISYWRERLEEVKGLENFYTIGMRGLHDGKMEGANTLEEQTKWMQKAIDDQRSLIAQTVNQRVETIPQAFIPYKEVLEVYNNGLKVPDDVTLVWCDDNYGNIIKLPSAEERKRSGGAGVYYHISYWGRPHDYLWLSTTSPSKIYYEMKKAYDNGAKRVWILNVGDIKPAEYETEFFLDLAWNIENVKSDNIMSHLHSWLCSSFGPDVCDELFEIKREYYHLAYSRKPEFMGWSRVEQTPIPWGLTPVEETEYSAFNMGDEIDKRMRRYGLLASKATQLVRLLPENKREAYFQIIEYPVRAAAAMNIKLLGAQKGRLYSKYSLPVANEYYKMSEDSYNEIAALSSHYNHDLLNGKWNGIMDMKPRDLPVFQPVHSNEKVNVEDIKGGVVWAEGDSIPLKSGDVKKNPPFQRGINSSQFIKIFSKGGVMPQWRFKNVPKWLRIEGVETGVKYEHKFLLHVDWEKVSKDSEKVIKLVVDNEVYSFCIAVLDHPADPKVENNGMIVWNGNEYDNSTERNILPINGLGYSEKCIELRCNEVLTYSIKTYSVGEVSLKVLLLPNHPVGGGSLRYEIAIDDEPFQIVDYTTLFGSEEWKQNVLRNGSVNTTYHNIKKEGVHIVKIRALDDGVVLDQFMLDFVKNRKYYEFPLIKGQGSNLGAD